MPQGAYRRPRPPRRPLSPTRDSARLPPRAKIFDFRVQARGVDAVGCLYSQHALDRRRTSRAWPVEGAAQRIIAILAVDHCPRWTLGLQDRAQDAGGPYAHASCVKRRDRRRRRKAPSPRNLVAERRGDEDCAVLSLDDEHIPIISSNPSTARTAIQPLEAVFEVAAAMPIPGKLRLWQRLRSFNLQVSSDSVHNGCFASTSDTSACCLDLVANLLFGERSLWWFRCVAEIDDVALTRRVPARALAAGLIRMWK